MLTKQNEVVPAKEVLFSREFKPSPEWETHQQYVSGVHFLSPQYLEATQTDDALKSWREFFKTAGVRESPDNGVEEFAVRYASEKLRPFCGTVTTVEPRNYGYDLQAVMHSGKTMYIEVKGQTTDNDAELTGNETEAADRYGDDFYLCVISSIPENPMAHMVRNPARVGRKDKLTIPVSDWKQAKWGTDLPEFN